jgi:hypothetical protein
MVSPESTRPSLSCDLCIVDFVSACVCKDVCRNSGEIIKLHEVFSNKGGGGGGAVKLYFVFRTHDSSQDFSYELIYMQYVGFSRYKPSTIF